MLFDPVYWLVIGAGMLLSLWASTKTKRTFSKYSKYTTQRGMTGADVARSILRDNGIGNVTVERVPGKLTDHYNPRTKILRLSEPVYDSASMAYVAAFITSLLTLLYWAMRLGLIGGRSDD